MSSQTRRETGAGSRNQRARSHTGQAPARRTLSRYRLVRRFSALLDVALGPLAVLTLVLILLEFAVEMSHPWNRLVVAGQLATWAVFLLAFLLEIGLAPHRLDYLRRNWLLLPALLVPALRVLRLAQALRLLRTARMARGLSVARGLTSVTRAGRALRSFLGFSQLVYLLMLAVVVWFATGALVYYLERSTTGGIHSLADSLWWTATVMTEVSTSIEPVSSEVRIVAVVLRLFGVAVIGYFTARLAVFFIGSSARTNHDSEFSNPGVDAGQIEALRREINSLREELQRDARRGKG